MRSNKPFKREGERKWHLPNHTFFSLSKDAILAEDWVTGESNEGSVSITFEQLERAWRSCAMYNDNEIVSLEALARELNLL